MVDESDASLLAKLNALPLILAGPLLRHTTNDSVTVWVAIKDSYQPDGITTAVDTVTLKVYPADHQEERELIMQGSKQVVKLGKHLSVVAITAHAKLPGGIPTAEPTNSYLQPGQIYEYDLEFDGGKRLRDAGIVSKQGGAAEIAYHPYKLPTFCLPPADLKDLRLIHASCRKPHAPGFDALAALDGMIESTADKASLRPHQLFLTGDQIYADDVADPLLIEMIKAAKLLMGWQEELPKKNEIKDFEKHLAPGKRRKIVDGAALSVSAGGLRGRKYAKSHSLTAGEFYAMYLLVWSNVLWPLGPPRYEIVYTDNGDSPRVKNIRIKYKKEWKEIDRFHLGLAAVRRALANVPSYMILDDHECTDDFFRDENWCNKVFNNDLGRRVVQNGLLAYALFQDWGNRPGIYEPQPAGPAKPNANSGHELLQAVSSWHQAEVIKDSKKRDEELAKISNYVGIPAKTDAICPVNSALQGQYNKTIQRPAEALDWHYVVHGPGYEVVVLEVRTRRVYAHDKLAQPLLMSGDYIKQIIDEVRPRVTQNIVEAKPPGTQENGDENPLATKLINDLKLQSTPVKIIFVVLPIPALFIPFIEKYGSQFSAGRQRRLYYYDIDFFSAPLGLETFIAALASLGTIEQDNIRRARIVFLSGDVHFSYTARLQYQAKRPFQGLFTSAELAQPSEAVIVQFTSSALKNQGTATSKQQYLHAHGFNPGPLFTQVGRVAGVGTGAFGAGKPYDYQPPKHIEVLGWNNSLPKDEPFIVGTKQYKDKLSSGLSPERPWCLFDNPALEIVYSETNDADDLDNASFPSDHRAVVSTAIIDTGKEEEWSYRIDYIRGDDTVTSKQVRKTEEVAKVDPPQPGPRTASLIKYLSFADNYRRFIRRGLGKEIVSLNNIAEITFRDSDTKNFYITQELWWYLDRPDSSSELPTPFPLTKTRVSLDFNDERYAKLKIRGRK